MKSFRSLVVVCFLLCVAFGRAQSPETGAHLPSQSAADFLREAAGADGAFLAAGLVKEKVTDDNLASLLQFPTDQLTVVKLTGGKIRLAIERALALFPQPNSSFLQLSGFEVTFSRTLSTGPRVSSITHDEAKLDDNKIYNIAMPSSLARGALGFFRIWDKNDIIKTDTRTIEDVLKGKKLTVTTARYTLIN